VFQRLRLIRICGADRETLIGVGEKYVEEIHNWHCSLDIARVGRPHRKK
jgi:hypothetical protein